MARKAGLATGVEVARITVKVSPDTREFRRELKRDLDDVEKQHRGGDETKVGVGADTKKMKEDVNRASRGLRAQVQLSTNKAELDRFQRRTSSELQSGLNRLEAKISLNEAGESFRRDIERAAKELDNLIKSPIPDSIADAAARRQQIREEIDALKALGEANENAKGIQLKLDDAADYRLRKRVAEAEAKAIDAKHKQQLAAWKDELNQMRVREDEARKFAELEKERLEAERQARRAPDDGWRKRMLADLRAAAKQAELQIPATIDGEKALRELREKVATLEKDIDADIPVDLELAAGQRLKIKKEIESIRPEVDVGISKTSGFSKLANSLFPNFGSGINISGYAVILGAILTVLAPITGLITTTLLALPGLVAAVVTPIAAITLGLDGFKKAAEKITPQFDHLKQVMSDVAESSFTPVLQNIADTIFPKLERSLPNVTKALADLANGVVNTFNEPENAVKFESSINRIATALSDMTPGFQGFTSGLIGLIDQFTLKLPAITEWFNKTGQDFDNWVQKVSSDGSLQGAFDNLGRTIKQVLDWVGDLGNVSFNFIKDPEALNGFLETLKRIGEIINGIVEASAKLNENWQSLVQVWRPFRAIADVLQGDLQGALGTTKDLFTNKPFLGATEEVEGLKNSLEGVPQSAADAQAALEKVLLPQGNSAQQPNDVAGALESLLTPKEPIQAPPVEPPDLEPAKAKVTEYQSFIDSVTQQVRGSLSQATTGESLPAPNFESFKTAWNELPKLVDQKGEEIRTAAAAIPGKIEGALGGLAGIGNTAGLSLMSGLTAGMQSGEGPLLAYVQTIAPKIAANKGPLPYDRKVLQPNGEALMFGLGKGMESGFQPVLEQAKGLAQQISEAFANGADPTQSIAGYSKDDINRIEKVLGLESKRLEAQAKALDYQAKTTGDDALKSRAAELRQQKEQLSLQKDMLDLTQDYNDEVGGGDDPLVKAASGLLNSPVDFAKSTGKQFLSDLGVGGDGLISRAVTEGIQYIFQIGSVDEALSIKDRTDAKQALSLVGR
ncbi:tail length tape measure protein [Mycobacterium phage EagleEye]|uniref:Tape measure protein n=1 Tax=Mycobacterium phage EagleEye TaxID=1429759 RepID=W0LIT4_9CAUD|nr:tail length tape measure protein [Mycobacterium phage EagleEye]AHG23808.1 tape measure protein [Mycobacterium phage EagleEye]QNJ55820.1 tape measure protein [Mycobacterium phage PainterBoy]